MKRVILLTGIMMFVGASAFATTIAVGIPTGFTGFSQSKNVLVTYGSGNGTGGACTAAAGDCTHFAASAKNTSGDKIYGAVDTSSVVWMKSGTAGIAVVAGDTPGLPTGPTYTPTGWTSM